MWGALLAYLRNQVGLKGDTASSIGSLHAKIADTRALYLSGLSIGSCVASDTAQYNDSAEESSGVAVSSYAKERSFKVFRAGTVRVSVDAYYNGYSTDVQLYVNSAAVGAVWHTSGISYGTHTWDIPVCFGDEIALYAQCSSGPTTLYTKNYKCSFDVGTTPTSSCGKITV